MVVHHTAMTTKDLEELIESVEEIAEDVATCFQFYKVRQSTLKDLLTKSNQN